MSKTVYFIVGPTGIGKTYLSKLIADLVPLEIVSADSRQIYRYMDIGTAKPDVEFRKKVPHHFIDICNPDDYYSAGLFGKEARMVIDQIFSKGKIPLVVGGSGFYIKALVDGIFDLEVRDQEIRKRLENELNQLGLPALYERLKKIDPSYAQKIAKNDRQRILRALEVYYVTEKPFSYFHQQKTTPASFKAIFWGLIMERQKLYEQINQRVQLMLDQGLVDEVVRLLNMGFSPQLNALNTVGYKEVIAYLENKISYSEMVDLIKRNTRRYAKRQLTWFKADPRIQWSQINDHNDLERLADKIKNTLIKTG